MNREQLKHLAVSSTVTFPATFPRLAEIRLRQSCDLPVACGEKEATFLVAIEHPSVRVTMKRVLPVSDVRAVFIPRDPNRVDLGDGTWLLDSEVEVGIQLQTASGGCLYGIVYVAEQTATLLEVEAGMTAAESTQYYPPLPCDRSVNHYDPHRNGHAPLPKEPEHPVAAGGSIVEPFMCEPFGQAAPQGPTELEPSREFRAQSAFAYCEPDAFQQQAYQTPSLRSSIQPAPFPSEEAPR